MTPMPDQKYSCILADPPWRFETWGKHTGNRHADTHYPTMGFDEILAVPMGEYAAETCALFLWVTQWLTPTHLLALEDAWGFKHKTKAFAWVKLSKTGLMHWGMGTATRQGSEDCLLWTRGDRSLVVAHDVHQVIVAPVREHSRKPDEQYDRIERLLGMQAPGGKLEMFARQSWPGWDTWGNETEKFEVGAATPAACQGVLL
jgi:N6-adenosine-specific RNA methylase IME4